jgi:catechol 2,3-dioxygenase-like lactoylglutathione lyase family enzyme
MESILGSNWKFRHVALVVRDMDKAKGKYGAILGSGIFRPETMLDSGTYASYEVYGKPAKNVHKSRFNHADIGAEKLDLEFISPVAGDPIYKDFLKKRGEGLHHIAFEVDDLDAEAAKVTARGIPMITSVKRPTGRGFAYFDFGDCIIELIGPVKVQK